MAHISKIILNHTVNHATTNMKSLVLFFTEIQNDTTAMVFLLSDIILRAILPVTTVQPQKTAWKFAKITTIIWVSATLLGTEQSVQGSHPPSLKFRHLLIKLAGDIYIYI